MMNTDFDRLIYLSILAVVIGLPVLFSYGRFRDLIKPLLAWLVVFVIAVVGVGMWQSITQSSRPSQTYVESTGDIVLPIGDDGHFSAVVNVNGIPIEFMVDTGASQIVLSPEDAEKLGFDLKSLAFIGTAYTANGPVSTAPIRLKSFKLGQFHDENVRATVNGGDVFGSLLGMDYLRRFGRIEITPEAMILRR
jgi:aspartyl protease family protein